MATYTYSVANDTLNGAATLTELTLEVEAQLSDLSYITINGDVLDIVFSTTLSGGDQTTLDAIVAAHTGIPDDRFGENLEDYLVLDGSSPMVGNLNMGTYSITNVNLVDGVDVSQHADRHELGGEDWLYVDRTQVSFDPSTYAPSTTFSGVSDPDHLGAHLEGIDNKLQELVSASSGNIFGNETTISGNSDFFSTTDQTYAEAIKMNFDVTVDGTYRLGWYYMWSYDDVTTSFSARGQLNDTTTIFEHVEEPFDASGIGAGGTDQRMPVSGFYYVSLVSGSHTMDIDIKSAKAGREAALHDKLLDVWRVA